MDGIEDDGRNWDAPVFSGIATRGKSKPSLNQSSTVKVGLTGLGLKNPESFPLFSRGRPTREE